MQVRWSGIDVTNYYGLGNDASASQPEDFYKVRQRTFSVFDQESA